MTIRVQYHNGVYDIVSATTLRRLIINGTIKKFYRYSEKRWVTIGVEPIRKGTQVLTPYAEPERRSPQIFGPPS